MGDADIDGVVGRDEWTTVVHLDGDPLGLPLARARNAGVAAALSAGAELVVLLDVDCVPAPGLLSAYEHAATRAPEALLAGPVTYLPEGVRVRNPSFDVTPASLVTAIVTERGVVSPPSADALAKLAR